MGVIFAAVNVGCACHSTRMNLVGLIACLDAMNIQSARHERKILWCSLTGWASFLPDVLKLLLLHVWGEKVVYFHLHTSAYICVLHLNATGKLQTIGMYGKFPVQISRNSPQLIQIRCLSNTMSTASPYQSMDTYNNHDRIVSMHAAPQFLCEGCCNTTVWIVTPGLSRQSLLCEQPWLFAIC